MTLMRNPPPLGTLRHAADTLRLDYTFSPARWLNFAHAWADFE